MPRPKKSVKIPKSIWVVYQDGERPGTGSIYAEFDEIGPVQDGELVYHYTLATRNPINVKEK